MSKQAVRGGCGFKSSIGKCSLSGYETIVGTISRDGGLRSIRIERDQNATVYPFKVVLHIVRRGMEKERKKKKKATDV